MNASVESKAQYLGAERLEDAAPDLARLLASTELEVSATPTVKRETVSVEMRDGVRLATNLYFPHAGRAPVIVVRTPYGRAANEETYFAFAQLGYIVIIQDVRGTGDSEPDSWDYYVYEPEDSFDLIDWVTRQEWFDGFIGSCGGSYLAATQWCMAAHPSMSAIAPEVGGLGFAVNSVSHYMFVNAFSRSVGKGAGKVSVHYSEMERAMVAETLAGGYFNEPLARPFPSILYQQYPNLRALTLREGRQWLWKHYCAIRPAQRVELLKQAFGTTDLTYVELGSLEHIFGHGTAYGAHALPCVSPSDVCRNLHAPALIITGWYDWGLNDAFATWNQLGRDGSKSIRSGSRLLITPSAHNAPGYRVGIEGNPELGRMYRTPNIINLLDQWYQAVRNHTTSSWPMVIYYMLGANEWRAASSWPPKDAHDLSLYLGAAGILTKQTPQSPSAHDEYVYDPEDPTPTVGGSIVSYVYTPGSADLSEVQERPDVLTYTTDPLKFDIDIVGPVRLILYASSSAVDTDFSARISDVFPDGRAIQLQSGILRVRYRDPDGIPELLEPGAVYRLEIDMWAIANRFKAGHCLRVDICSADFPRFDRNANRGGEPGPSIPARQSIYHDSDHPSHLVLSVVGDPQSNMDAIS